MKWSDITIKQYQNIIAIANTDLPNFNKEVELVSYLFNIDKALVLKMPIEQFKEYSKQLSFIEEIYDGKMITEFTIDGVDYVVNWRMENRTAGQFIDLCELTKDAGLINDNLHKIMAVICLPKGESYDGKIKERADVFLNKLTMDIVYPLAAFFLTIFETSLPIIADYLDKEITRKNKELLRMIKDSLSIGDGISHSMN